MEKKTRKATALLMALVIVFSFAVPVSVAAGDVTVINLSELEAALINTACDEIIFNCDGEIIELGASLNITRDIEFRAVSGTEVTLSIADNRTFRHITSNTAGVSITIGEGIILDGGGIGGGIQISGSGCELILDGCTITKCNKVGNGGGINFSGGTEVATLTINDGTTISYCTSTGDGGGVSCGVSSNLIINKGALITYNESGVYGGGVTINGSYNASNPSTLTINDGEISYNNTGFYGGGIYVQNAQIVIEDGKILDNKALNSSSTYGGGIAISKMDNAYTSFIMNGGTIKDNTSGCWGGGIALVNPISKFEITGGEITGNETLSGSNQGGGIYLNGTTLNLSGTAIISENKAGSGGGIFVNASSLNVDGDVKINENEALYSAGGIYGYYGATITIEGHAKVTGNKSYGTPYIYQGAISSNRGGGGIALYMSSLTVKDSVEISGNFAENFGGGIYSLDYDNASTISIESGTIENNEAICGGGIAVSTGPSTISSLTISGGTITKNSAEKDGGGIYAGGVYGGGTVTINGGDISYNTAENDGGGIWIDDRKNLTVEENVTFSKNTAVEAYYMDNQDDIDLHEAKIKTLSRSAPPRGNLYFDYAYNNYDIVYKSGQEAFERYSVTFVANGGAEVPIQWVNKDEKAIEPQDYTRKGYTFYGWFTDDLCNDEYYFTELVTDDIILYAKWTIETYTVTFDSKGGSPVSPLTVDYGDTANEPENPDRNGYDFINWYEDSEFNNLYNFDTPVVDNITLYAKWTIKTYTVTFETYGGSPIPAQQIVAHGNTAAQPPNPTRTNYTFRGWYSDANTTSTYDFSTPITNDITLYAGWRSTNTGSGSGGGGTNTGTDTGGDDNTGSSDGETGDGVTGTGETGGGGDFDTGYNIGDTTPGGYIVGEGSGRDPSNPYDDIIIIGEEGVPLGNLELSNHIKYLNGYPDGTVKPEQSITRAEAAVIFYRLLSDKGKETETTQAFSDVTDSKWYYKEVNYLASLGIVTGYSDGTFHPDKPITRAEFSAIASRFDSLILTTGTAFVDVAEDFWAVKYINSNYIRGWIDGYNDYSYKPDQSITRSEVVKMVNTMLTRLPETLPDGINPYTDITESYWAYIHIMEASIEHGYLRNNDNVEYWTSSSGITETAVSNLPIGIDTDN